MDVHVEKVAETLHTFLCKIPWRHMSDSHQNLCRHMAAAAIEALNLTPEWTWSWLDPGTNQPGYGHSVPSREEAEAEADPYMTVVSRLVGGWVENIRSEDD